MYAVNATAQQGIDFALGIQVVGNFLAVDLETYGVELEVLADAFLEPASELLGILQFGISGGFGDR